MQNNHSGMQNDHKEIQKGCKGATEILRDTKTTPSFTFPTLGHLNCFCVDRSDRAERAS